MSLKIAAQAPRISTPVAPIVMAEAAIISARSTKRIIFRRHIMAQQWYRERGFVVAGSYPPVAFMFVEKGLDQIALFGEQCDK